MCMRTYTPQSDDIKSCQLNFSIQRQKRGQAPQGTPGMIQARVGILWCTGRF